MPGSHPIEYYMNPNMHRERSMDEIYTDLDRFSDEVVLPGGNLDNICLFAALPPLTYENQFVKGVLVTNAADLLVQRHPELKEIFNVVAYSMWSSLPISQHADGLCCSFANPEREKWWRAKYPQRNHQVWLPFQDADLTSHYLYQPQNFQRNIDILCVSRIDICKNLPILAQALKILRDKYPQTPRNAVLMPWRKMELNWVGLLPHEYEILGEINRILGATPLYLQYGPEPRSDLWNVYSSAKLVVLCSLFEGKNRSLQEAFFCNTPAVVFAQHCQYARGETPVLPVGAGMAAPEFTAESLADTLHQTLENHTKFSPRLSSLKISGRSNVLDMCIERLPYYATHLPGFVAGAQHHTNPWLDAATLHTHRCSLNDFMYKDAEPGYYIRGLEPVDAFVGKCMRLLPAKRLADALSQGQPAAAVAQPAVSLASVVAA